MRATLRLAAANDAVAVATVLIESRRAFLPFAPLAHTPDEVNLWVREHLIPTGHVHVAELAGKVVAVLATSECEDVSWIDQLYLLPGFDGQGIGTQLLQLAHSSLRRPVRLHTFQANSRARRFYERHGYKAIKFTDGSSNEERCPDVLYEISSAGAEA